MSSQFRDHGLADPVRIMKVVSKKEIDQYLANVEEPKRTTLQKLRETILSIIPDAEQCISYQVPAFKLHGQVVAGFAASKNHLSYLPFSGSVIPKLRDELTGYASSAGALNFPVDKPVPKKLIKKLIEVRVAQVLQRQAGAKPGWSGKRGAVSKTLATKTSAVRAGEGSPKSPHSELTNTPVSRPPAHS